MGPGSVPVGSLRSVAAGSFVPVAASGSAMASMWMPCAASAAALEGWTVRLHLPSWCGGWLRAKPDLCILCGFQRTQCVGGLCMAQACALHRSTYPCWEAWLQNCVCAAAQRLLVLHLQLSQNGQLPWGEGREIGLSVLSWVPGHRCLCRCWVKLRHHWHHGWCWVGLLLNPLDGLQRWDVKGGGCWVGKRGGERQGWHGELVLDG